MGPYAVIDGDVELGEGCRVGVGVHLTGHTTAGAGNFFDTGCAIGGLPQDVRFGGGATRLRIGANNVFREHVTVHRSNRLEEDTRIGDGNLLMAHAHVGHNCRLGDRIIIANGALLGGHVEVHDRAFISGNCLVHQFVRIGTLSLMQGGSAVSKDLAPFCIARGPNAIAGLNVVGMRRAGMAAEARLEIRALYHALFRGRGRFAEAIERARTLVRSDWGRELVDFVAASRRGVVRESRRSARASGAEMEE